jgi:hypothetical protein
MDMLLRISVKNCMESDIILKKIFSIKNSALEGMREIHFLKRELG